MARPYWLHLAGVFALCVVQTPLALLNPLPVKIVVDSVLGGHPLPSAVAWAVPASASSMARLWLAAGLLVALTLLVYLESLASWWLRTYAGEKLTVEFRAALFRHTQRLSLAYHDTRGAADSTYRIQNDAQCFQVIAISAGAPLANAALSVVAMVIVTAWLDLELALIALAVCPVLYFLAERFRHRIRERWMEVRRLDSSVMGVVQEVLSALRVVKAFGREEHEQERFLRQSDQRVQRQLDLALLNGRFDLWVGMTIAAGSALVLIVGVFHVQAGTLTLGSLLMVLFYLAQIYDPLRTISSKLAEMQSGISGAERAFAVLDEVPEVAERPNASALERAHGMVAFRNVEFAYQPGVPVLNDICFEVRAGARVGIQGRTGAGKSTLISLMMRFYDPQHGQILLDGVDVRDYRLVDLRNQFSMVLQDPVLFSSSIAENIAYGKPGASREEVIEAARRANAHDFIERLPDGYESEVGERGMKLSGGERQRISLARAFLRDAPILILDEPTSSVDVATESAIMEAIERLMQGRTTFIIAHRLSTLEGCDVRLEMEHGRLLSGANRTPA